MAAVDADTWVLTETWEGFAPSPDHRLVATSTAAADRESERGERWVAIWSRLPATSIDLTAEPDRTAAALIDIPEQPPLICYGTVLPWLGDPKRAPLTGAAAFVAALAEQSGEWRALCARHPEAALVVAGDFNQDLAERHYYGSRAGKAALGAALEQLELVCVTGGDADPLRDRPGRASIDHICVSGRCEVLGVGAWPSGPLPRGLTDHFGAWTDMVSRQSCE